MVKSHQLNERRRANNSDGDSASSLSHNRSLLPAEPDGNESPIEPSTQAHTQAHALEAQF